MEEVVVEGPSKKDRAVLSGRTRQNKLVHFRSAERLRPGTYALVGIPTFWFTVASLNQRWIQSAVNETLFISSRWNAKRRTRIRIAVAAAASRAPDAYRLILLVIGLLIKIPILWTLGVIALVVGAVLLILGAAGTLTLTDSAISGGNAPMPKVTAETIAA